MGVYNNSIKFEGKSYQNLDNYLIKEASFNLLLMATAGYQTTDSSFSLTTSAQASVLN